MTVLIPKSTVPFWNEPNGTDDWDVLILGGEFMPGIARVQLTVEYDLDTKKPKGSDGWSMTDNGEVPAPLSIELLMWTSAQLREFERVLPLLRAAKKGGRRDPLGIVHPIASLAGIDAVTIKKFTLPMPDSVNGWRVPIEAIQWFPEPKPKTQAIGKGGETPKSTVDQVNDITEKAIAKAQEDAEDSPSKSLGTGLADVADGIISDYT